VAQRCSNDSLPRFARVSPQIAARNFAFERLLIAINMQRAWISEDQ